MGIVSRSISPVTKQASSNTPVSPNATGKSLAGGASNQKPSDPNKPEEQVSTPVAESNTPEKSSIQSRAGEPAVFERIAKQNSAMTDKLNQMSASGPTNSDALAGQLAASNPMGGMSMPPFPTSKPSGGSSGGGSSSAQKEIKELKENFTETINNQNKQLKGLKEQLSEKNKLIAELRPPKFGDIDKKAEAEADKKDGSEENEKEKSEEQSKNTATVAILGINFSDYDDVDTSQTA
jgi:hypothetical protein